MTSVMDGGGCGKANQVGGSYQNLFKMMGQNAKLAQKWNLAPLVY
jgi:hypothetical protein